MANYPGTITDEPSFKRIFMGGPFHASASTGIVAFAGGGQANATLLNGDINVVNTVATAADSTVLPNAVAGREITVTNASANSMAVFPAVGDNINALGANTSLAVAAGKTSTLLCALKGQWYALQSA